MLLDSLTYLFNRLQYRNNFLQSIGIIRKEPENPVPNGFPIDNHIRILYTQIIRLESYTGSITQKERSYTLNHLAMILILTVIAHLLWFAVMTERKYSLKKTLLLYGFYAVFFTLWSLLAFSLLGKDSPYVIPFSFIGTILPAFLLFLYTSSDTFCKKLFLLITYANLFCIFICISISLEPILVFVTSIIKLFAWFFFFLKLPSITYLPLPVISFKSNLSLLII